MDDAKIIAGWLAEARARLAASTGEHEALIWRLAISGLEKAAQGIPADERETRAFRIAVFNERPDPSRLH